MDRIIPPFYCVYLLRSTISHQSLYVGSTPNPRRRLKQHNGLSTGGAAQTASAKKRPWEMTAIVTGFPSKIAALQFEWAWQNTHLTRHIPRDERITASRTIQTMRKNGKARKRMARPRVSMADKLSNLQLLLRVKSFARWPLQLRFFSPDVYKAWQKWCSRSFKAIRPGITVTLDAPDSSVTATIAIKSSVQPGLCDQPDPEEKPVQTRIEALDVGYEMMKPYLTKTTTMLTDDAKPNCAICLHVLNTKHDFVLVCSAKSCSMTSHLKCLATQFLNNESKSEAILPIEGECPECKELLNWSDLTRNLSLRTRGREELSNLLKEPRQKKTKLDTHTAGKDSVAVNEENLADLVKTASFKIPVYVDKNYDSSGDSGEDDDDDLVYRDPSDEAAAKLDLPDPFDNIFSDDMEEPEVPLPLQPTQGKIRQTPLHGRDKSFPIVIANSESDGMDDILDWKPSLGE